MLHVRGPSRDGVIGRSPIQIARGAMSLAMGGADTAEAFVANGVRPTGILTIDQVLKPEQRKAIKQNIVAPLAGSVNAGGVFVLEAGMKFQPVTMTMEDAQFLETRKLSNEDVASIFDCPPTSVGIVDRSTYSNTEQEALALVRNCLAPLAARFESAFARCLLTETGRREYFVRHDFAELLRGDMKTRFEAYRLGRECGVYSADDVRRLENEAPIPGGAGATYHMPANWISLGVGNANANGGATP